MPLRSGGDPREHEGGHRDKHRDEYRDEHRDRYPDEHHADGLMTQTGGSDQRLRVALSDLAAGFAIGLAVGVGYWFWP